MKAYHLVILVLAFFIGCSERKEENSTDLMTYLSSLEKLDTDIHMVEDSEVLHSPHRMAVLSDGKMIINNARVWDLHLIDKENNFLSKAGGIGRGPGEFSRINRISVSEDTIYVLDLGLKRVETYGLLGNKLEPLITMNLPSYEGIYLKDFFKTDGRYFGVFQESSMQGIETETGERVSHPFKLYELNEELSPERLVVEYDGNALVKNHLVKGFFEDRLFGEESLWDFSDGKFYYSSNMSFTLEEIDLSTMERRTHDFTEIPQRKKEQSELDYILRNYQMMFQMNEAAKELIENQSFLPSFIDFKVSDDHAYFEVWSFSDTEESMILRINLTTGEKQVIETFPFYSMKAVENEHIFGFDQTEEETMIKILEIN